MLDDVEELFRRHLGAAYDPLRMTRVLDLARSLRADKTMLDRAARAGTMTGEAFAEQTNGLLREYLGRIAAVLGPEDYQRVFGVMPDERLDIADPAVAATVPYHR